MSEIERNTRWLVVLLRSRRTNMRRKTRITVESMRLFKPNHAVLIDDRKTYQGMLQYAKDYITYGEINIETLFYLLHKRGRVTGNKKLTDEYVKGHSSFGSIRDFAEAFLSFKAEISDVEGLKPVFRLHPPRKGFPKIGKNKPFHIGGAVGYRGEAINDLIPKMA